MDFRSIFNEGVDCSHNMPQHKMVICFPKPHIAPLEILRDWFISFSRGLEKSKNIKPSSDTLQKGTYAHLCVAFGNACENKKIL